MAPNGGDDESFCVGHEKGGCAKRRTEERPAFFFPDGRCMTSSVRSIRPYGAMAESSDPNFAGASAWVNGPYLSDTHGLWAELEARAPLPVRKKRAESPAKASRKALTDRVDISGDPQLEPAGSKGVKPATLAGVKASSSSSNKKGRLPSDRKGAAKPSAPSQRGKAKSHRARSPSPAKQRPALTQPEWDRRGPPKRASGEVINKYNHVGLNNEEAAAGWGAGAEPSSVDMSASCASIASSVPRVNRVTTSPSTRAHPNPDRRAELRKADMHSNINDFATSPNGRSGPTYLAPDNDRKMKEASWISSQAWFESLRYYPKGEEAVANDDCEATYSGNTHGSTAPSEHIENDVRNRVGMAAADPGWSPSQLPEPWAPEMELRLKRLAVSRPTAVE
jgi:hypothetical protein